MRLKIFFQVVLIIMVAAVVGAEPLGIPLSRIEQIGFLTWLCACLGLLAFDVGDSPRLGGFLAILNGVAFTLTLAGPEDRFLLVFFVGQWVLLLRLISAIDAGPGKRLAEVSFAATLPILALVFRSLKDQPDYQFHILLGAGALNALVPAWIRFKREGLLAFEWKVLLLQQTILRLGIVCVTPLLVIDVQKDTPKAWAFVLAAFATSVLLVCLFRKMSDVWERGYQILTTLFIVSQSLYPNMFVFALLLTLSALVAASSGTPSVQMGINNRISSVLRPLENGGIGGGPFFLSLLAIYFNQEKMGQTVTSLWILILVFAGGLAWMRNETSSPTFRTEDRDLRWLIGKTVLQASLVAVVLILGAKYV